MNKEKTSVCVAQDEKSRVKTLIEAIKSKSSTEPEKLPDSENKMTLVVNAQNNEAFVRSTVSAFCIPLNPSIEEISDIKTAVSEAVTNCSVHAYESKGGEIVVSVMLSGDIVHISITDKGKGIEDVEKAKQPMFTTMPHFERSGMGFTVMESFMDSVEVISKVNHGTTVTMSKKIGSNN